MLEDSMTLLAPLPRGEGVALWRQIASRIEARIHNGELEAGARLPTEAVLAESFGVNRHTIRRAMEDLVTRGLVRVEQGRGSFVAEDIVEYPLGSRTRFSEIIRAQSREPSGRILRVSESEAEPRIAELLKLKRGQRNVVIVERLGFANSKPVTLGSHHFPAHRFGRIPTLLKDNPSITAALSSCGIPDYRRQVTRITARMPTPEEAALLEQARSRPVLLAEAVNIEPGGTPVEVSIARYAAGRMQIVVETE
ncbi:phosphonate metabolism transcriptional regulator PhnF [Rhodovarius crocodyli]|uniref:Phosphonate metabolism transcriptional regulator PhnF n=1 Tax=Rhodovarius crocodyli TaxID=1979269 RepID=A0A437MCS6_9PROT|nr:phosphonate metabolism transcriptional regulator PhnF [Rhodovarius crocodyli]RVT95446.1 phosphonate metabolism transcriptional regulator PhnF [Rhodovarius crocodyli]